MRNGSATRYDELGRPERWAHYDTNQGTPPVVVGFEYAYDQAGNKTAQTSLHDEKDSQEYHYDTTGRLADYTREDSGGDTWPGLDKAGEWSLDGVGNWSRMDRTDSDDATTSETRLDTSFNEYYSVGGVAQSHDDNGNLLDDGARNL